MVLVEADDRAIGAAARYQNSPQLERPAIA
jgi:hypothetical protein